MNSVVMAARIAAEKKKAQTVKLGSHANFVAKLQQKPKTKPTQEMIHQRAAEVDVRKPHFKVMVNIFYELVNIQSHILYLITKDMEYIRYGATFNDKKLTEKICSLFKEIRDINDEMSESLWDGMDKKVWEELRKESNDILRIIALGCDRCLREDFKWSMIEEFIKTMPSKGLFSDDIVEQFRLG